MIVIRPYLSALPDDPRDEHYLYSSWLRAYKTSPYVGPIPNNLYWEVTKLTIKQLLERSSTVVNVAVHPEDTEQIFGYIVGESASFPPVVHFLFVREVFRRHGIGKALLDSILDKNRTFRYTFKTRDVRYLPSEYSGIYSPHIVRKKPKETFGVLTDANPPRKQP